MKTQRNDSRGPQTNLIRITNGGRRASIYQENYFAFAVFEAVLAEAFLAAEALATDDLDEVLLPVPFEPDDAALLVLPDFDFDGLAAGFALFVSDLAALDFELAVLVFAVPDAVDLPPAGFFAVVFATVSETVPAAFTAASATPATAPAAAPDTSSPTTSFVFSTIVSSVPFFADFFVAILISFILNFDFRSKYELSVRYNLKVTVNVCERT